jgi:hypothetical protein
MYADLGYTFQFGKRSLRLGGTYTYATGDKDPTDGRIQTFDSLFPDPFIFHGRTFVVGGTNIQDFTFKIRGNFWKGGLVELNYHNLHLTEPRDALYDGAAFRPLRRDLPGRAGRYLGHEIDFQVTHAFHDNFSVSGGVFLFQPEDFFNRTGNANRADDLTRNFFLMVRVGF